MVPHHASSTQCTWCCSKQHIPRPLPSPLAQQQAGLLLCHAPINAHCCCILLLLLLAVQVTKSATAPDGKLWVFFGLHVVQPAAQAYCQQSGGNLVTVDSANKTQFLVKKFLEPFSDIVYGVWIGLYMPATGADPTDKSQYKWYSDAPMDTYSNWGADEPSGDAKAQLGSASCGHAAPPNNGGGGLPGGSWNDVSCDRDVNPRPFICEFLQS